jgi:hypothetical protein
VQRARRENNCIPGSTFSTVYRLWWVIVTGSKLGCASGGNDKNQDFLFHFSIRFIFWSCHRLLIPEWHVWIPLQQ